MQQKLELYDLDLNHSAAAIGAKVFETEGFTPVDRKDFAGWLFEQGYVANWCEISDCNGQLEILVEHHDARHLPVRLTHWLRAEDDRDELVIRYLDSIGNFDAALALAKSQQWAERVPEELTEDQKKQWLIQHWEVFED
jgi:hypothetical protein